ncbi:hypothetical protein GCM10027577_15730 [Spirosoma fluminis]
MNSLASPSVFYTLMNRLLRIGQTAVDYLLFSNVFIACCALAMTAGTASVFALDLPRSFWGLSFAGAVCSYSLHSYLTLPVDASRRRLHWIDAHRRLLVRLFACGAIIALYWLWQLRAYWLYWLPAAVVTFLYTAPKINRYPFMYLRKVAVLKTLYLAGAWTYVTVLLPLLMTVTVWQERMSWWALNRFFWLYCVCFWFDYRDRAEDGQSRYLTLVAGMNERQATLFFSALVGSFTFTLFQLYEHGFSADQLMRAALPVVLLALVTNQLRHTTSDYWYYGYVDSLLLLSGAVWLV